jgi:nucleoside-diphosphate-sugar epimerase
MRILITGGNGNIAKIIKKKLENTYDIINPSRHELNLLEYEQVEKYLSNNTFDILIHTAISGGRRTKEEDYNVVYNNLLMFENIMKFNDKFKMIINLDSGSIYERKYDINKKSENQLDTVPTDFYGFSKYLIYQRTLYYKHCFNFRIFNLFHPNEENDRFIKACFLAKINNSTITINEDKYFDFFYEKDFIKVLDYYLNKMNNQEILPKTINLSYKEKYRLSEIAIKIIEKDKIIINKKYSNNNYCGDNSLLYSLNLDLIGLEESIKLYEIQSKEIKNKKN